MILVADIKAAVALEFKVPVEAMSEPDGAMGSRLRDRVRPRQAAMFFSRQLTHQRSDRPVLRSARSRDGSRGVQARRGHAPR